MPKFSAYMRGEKGIQGETGQASLLDGIVEGYNNLPDKANLTEDKNYVYYVKENDGIYLYVYEGGSGKEWQLLGMVTAGFSTIQYATVSTKEWFPGIQPDVIITPHDDQQTTGLKSFNFHFDIPEGQPAGFNTVSASAINIDFGNQPQVSITTNGNNWEKNFHFDFEIPKGEPAGFSTGMTFTIEALPSTSNATVSIIPNPNSPNNAKEFDFNFGIPTGRPGGFGEISVTTTQVDSTIPAEVSITTSGEDYSKNFYFNFKIPKGQKGNPGDALGTYLGINFTTTDIDSNNDIYWNNNILHIKRDDNAKIPICILNNENNNIASTFELTENEILYYADSPFNGILYLISKSNIPTFKIGKCTTISYEQNPYVEAYYENENNPYEITLDFYLTRGTSTEILDTMTWGNIIGNISEQIDLQNLLDAKVNISDLGSMALVNDVENDNKQYVRKNGTWQEIIIENQGGGSENPSFSGKGIDYIDLSSSTGLIDTYTIYYTDGTSSTFNVTNGEMGPEGPEGPMGETGRGINSIQLTSSIGLIDTYTIYYTDGTTSTFNVTNGTNGNNEEVNPFEIIKINEDGSIVSGEEFDYTSYKINKNLSLRTPNWETEDNTNAKSEPFIYFYESQNQKIGELSLFHSENNSAGIQLQASQLINNIQYKNNFKIGINSDGSFFYKISDTTNFVKELGANNLGVWPINMGGTGAKTVQEHKVFMGPTNGSEAPSFRELEESDIPQLSLSKISGNISINSDQFSGILPLTKGGTGVGNDQSTYLSQRLFLASPINGQGQVSFRSIENVDLPNGIPITKLPISYTTNDNITSLTNGWLMLVYEG